jgi:curved DNA-binding protein CbpA
MPAAPTLYEILNVSADAEPVVIEAAYRALMKKYHPDQAIAAGAAGGPTAAQINQAYAVLRDAERRADYDRREGMRAQNIQLAHYAPPPADRIGRVFGWGGWIVALILGGIIALMAERASDMAAARAEAARAAALALPDFRSQPSLPDEASVAAIAATVPPPPAPAAVPRVPGATAGGEAPAAQRPRRPARAAPRAAPRPRRARTAQEKDFLEREGYIY